MYRELVISIIIVIIIVLLDCGTQKYTDSVVTETIDKLVEIKQNMKENEKSNEDIIYQMDEIYQKWTECHKKLAYFIEHDELEKVETEFVSAKSYIKSKQYDLADAEIEKTIFILEHISDKYSLTLENIF